MDNVQTGTRVCKRFLKIILSKILVHVCGVYTCPYMFEAKRVVSTQNYLSQEKRTIHSLFENVQYFKETMYILKTRF